MGLARNRGLVRLLPVLVAAGVWAACDGQPPAAHGGGQASGGGGGAAGGGAGAGGAPLSPGNVDGAAPGAEVGAAGALEVLRRPPFPPRDLPPTAPARPNLAVNALLRFEDPRLIAPWIAEAALHEDAVRTPKESLVGQALVPLIHGQLLLETPALARRGTLLARQLNGLLFGRLNSRDTEGRLRLTASRGDIFPGSVTNIGSFLGVFIPFGPDTPGGRTLWDMVTAVTGQGTFQGTFSVTTIRLLEDRQTLWSAEQIVTLLRVLEANLP